MIKKSSVIYGLLLSVSGFLIAALLNALIPITAPVVINQYTIGGSVININTAYRVVLYFLSALFLVLGLTSLKDTSPCTRNRADRKKSTILYAMLIVTTVPPM